MRTAFVAAAFAVVSTFTGTLLADEDSVAHRRVYFTQLAGVSTAGFQSSLFTYARSGLADGNYTEETESFRTAPTADVRVAGMLTLGATIGAGFDRFHFRSSGPGGYDNQLTGWSVFALPRVGLLVPLGKRFAVWPRVGAGFLIGDQKSESVTVATTGTRAGVLLGADALLLVGVTREIFVSLGPSLGWSSTTFTSTGGGATQLQVGVAAAFGIAL